MPTQWVTVCRCDRPYSANQQFSIDVCAACKKRVGDNASGRHKGPDLCSCDRPDPRQIASFLKPNEAEPVSLDLASVGLTSENFPTERYHPIAFLGDSPRATTVMARDKQRGSKVAIKCFKRVPASMQATFQSEAKKIQLLTHTNIAKILDFGFPNLRPPYLVTEYKDGFNLAQCLALYGVPSFDVAVKILVDLCEVLIYSQKQGTLHRDVRPENIIFYDDLNSEPTVWITDYAFPKTRAGEGMSERCDVLYMSGDEARNLDYSEKSEVYCIGSVGFSLLTRKAPFPEGTAQEIKNNHALKLAPRVSSLNHDPKRPGDLEEVIERCMEKDPNVRFDSIEKLKERLDVFPRREKMRIAAILSARKRKLFTRIGLIGLGVAVACAAGYFAFAPH